MCTQANYSKYQRRVIKFLTDYLGSDIPFTYQRSQNNHLKILIDGVEKPMFTGSTPSDCKSINNFMAEVKREVKLSQELNTETTDTCKPALPSSMKINRERLIQNSVKSLRTRLESIQSKEEAMILGNNSLDCITRLRTATVKQALALSVQARKQGVYLKSTEMKSLETAIAKHLDFMLPTIAYYAELRKTNQKPMRNQDTTPLVEYPAISKEAEMKKTTSHKPSKSNNAMAIEDNAQTMRNIDATALSARESKETTKSTKQQASVVMELMAMPGRERVSQLQELSKQQALMLIDDINLALASNKEADIKKVIALIRENDLPIEAILSGIEAA
jgi:uncharacterized protein YajQ (UPF0234 family)